MRHMLLLTGLAGCLAGCSSAGAGVGQVAIRTDPSGATCTVQRGGTVLGVVAPTPGVLAVDPSERDLLVTCTKPGFQPASGTVKAIYKGVGVGQLLTGGAAAVVEDAAKGTDFRYDPAGVTVTLAPG